MSLSSAKLGISNMLWVGHMYSVKKHPGGPIDFSSFMCLLFRLWTDLKQKQLIIYIYIYIPEQTSWVHCLKPVAFSTKGNA